MAFENQNLENKSNLGFKIGDKIIVKRTSGNIENDWTVSDIYSTENDTIVSAQKFDENGHGMYKIYSKKREPDKFQELLDLNKLKP